MTDIPEPVTLEWIARQLVEMREETCGDLHGAGGQIGSVGSDMQSLRASTRTLIEMLSRVEAKMIALHKEMRAFIEEERQHARLTGRDA
jgi:hypothetical protein